MSEWKTYSLGKDVVTKLGDGLHGTPNYDDNGAYYFINGSNLVDGKIVINSNTKKVTEEEFIKYKKDLSDKTILLGINGTIGNVALYNNEMCILGKSAAYININDDFDKQFVRYVLTNDHFQNYIKNNASGTTIKNVGLGLLREYEFSLDDKIEQNLQLNQTLEAMAQALFKEWFVNFNSPNFDGELENGLPMGWRMGKFEELIEFTNGYAFKSNELLGQYEEDCYFVFKMGNIKKGGGLKYDGTKSFYKKENSQNLKKYVLKRGDLLMCMTDMKDNVALLGHTALMNEDDKFIVNQRVGLIRPKNDISIDFPYLYILTNFPEFIEELRSRANRGVQVNLSTSEIKNIQVVIPPKSVNQLFDNTLKPIFNKIFSNIEQIQSLTQTRDTLLPKLMSGKIEIKN
ncbi:MAG: restriction endonuclease subunit S [Bacteroidetes bacterium]|nr:restriction endonuclease subunit S [Bacteroidota bacterium]